MCASYRSLGPDKFSLLPFRFFVIYYSFLVVGVGKCCAPRRGLYTFKLQQSKLNHFWCKMLGTHGREKNGLHSSSLKNGRNSNSSSFQHRYSGGSLEGKRNHFSTSMVLRQSNSIDNERRKQEEKKSEDELSLGKLPDQNERIKEGFVMKLCQEEWQPRFIVVTGLQTTSYFYCVSLDR